MNFSRLKWLLPLLLPLSWLYGVVIRFRNCLYDWGIFRVHWVPAPVVSVGNLTVGGTGKTPIVMFLSRLYRARGKQVGILSRGYGRVSKNRILVFEGESDVAPEKIGDEPYLIFQNLKSIPIAVDKNRWKGGLALWQKEPVDVFLLDDAFQYRAIFKQVEIAVLDAAHPFGNGHVLPAGWLREPLSALKRASLVWLTRVDEAQNLGEVLRKLIHCTHAPVVQSVHKPEEFSRVDRSEQRPLEFFREKAVTAFSAIGNPESFRRTLEKLNVDIKYFKSFPDHYQFTGKDINFIRRQAKNRETEYILCTEKDAVKLEKIAPDFWFLRISIQIVRGEENLLDLLPNLQ